MPALPEGTVTFVFSDVEGSTQLLERHGAALLAALARHHELFEEIVHRHHGVIFKTVGDAVDAAFSGAGEAIGAALDAQRALATEDWGAVGRIAVRIAIHTGSVERRGHDYFGPALFRVARLQALGYGEQTLISGVTARLAADDLPPEAWLDDLGIHRLKDLGEPEHVFQLRHPALRTDFPALKALDAHPHNLPLQLSSFVARERELRDLGTLLEAHRLVTLIGPGGIGKTRLALQAAADHLDSYPDGAWFVDLAPVRDAALLETTVSLGLGLAADARIDPSELLQRHLRTHSLLLVLDNMEQLRDGAASTVTRWLQTAPDLRILATSRAPLRVRGEHEFPVPSLAVGRADVLEAEPPAAVVLFAERAKEIRPDLEINAETGPLIATICERLDGLPLAIELAAARLRLFSLSELRQRLAERLPLLVGGARDLPVRQQTLRAAIEWSEGLLSDKERILFRRLGVFAHGFSYGAAAALLEEEEVADLPDLLSALLEESLLKADTGAGPSRYTVLETVREYARDALTADSAFDATMDRIAAYYQRIATDAETQMLTSRQAETLKSLDREIDNLRALLIWLRDQGEAERLGSIVVSLSHYWFMRGLSREGRGWIEAALRIVPDGSARLRADLLKAEANFELYREPGRAVGLLREAADSYRHAGLSSKLAETLGGLASALQTSGNYDAAVEAANEGLAVSRLAGNLRAEAASTGNLAIVAKKRGDLLAAEAGIRSAVTLFSQVGDQHSVIIGLGNLSAVALLRGDLPGAADAAHGAVEAARVLGSPPLEGWALANLGDALQRSGEQTAAGTAIVASLPLLAEAEDTTAILGAFDTAGSILSARGDPYSALVAWACASHIADREGIELERDETQRQQIEAVRANLAPEVADAAADAAALLELNGASQFILEAVRAVSIESPPRARKRGESRCRSHALTQRRRADPGSSNER